VRPTDIVNLTVTGHPLNEPGMTFTRAPRSTALTAGSGCSINIQTNVARCQVGPGGALRLTTADRDDVIDASNTALPFDASAPEQFNTAGGDDVLVAGPLADIVNAGAGDDGITGGPGPDQLHGDAGDDTFLGLTAGDVVDGGDGTDVLDLGGLGGGGVAISLDGVANDGPLGGRCERQRDRGVRGTPSSDLLTPADLPPRPCGAPPVTT
jgi:Ca2+-binding RTX toxin-like protein